MMVIKGYYYNGRDSGRQEMTVRQAGGMLQFFIGESMETECRLSDIDISKRIGDNPRHFTLSDGASFETNDNEAVDAMLSGHDMDKSGRLVHKLESKWRYVAFSLVFVVVFCYTVVIYGVPFFCREGGVSAPDRDKYPYRRAYSGNIG